MFEVYTSRQEVHSLKNHISFRLRKELDADLIRMNIDENELPDLCRNGLRLMLGIRTVRRMEVQERPLHIPAPATAEEYPQFRGDPKKRRPSLNNRDLPSTCRRRTVSGNTLVNPMPS